MTDISERAIRVVATRWCIYIAKAIGVYIILVIAIVASQPPESDHKVLMLTALPAIWAVALWCAYRAARFVKEVAKFQFIKACKSYDVDQKNGD